MNRHYQLPSTVVNFSHGEQATSAEGATNPDHAITQMCIPASERPGGCGGGDECQSFLRMFSACNVNMYRYGLDGTGFDGMGS